MSQGLHAPFCKPNCTHEHHPLLVAIFNFKDTDVKESIRVIEEEIKKLEKAVLPNGTKWLKHQDIPDPGVNFQYSPLHWACAFGFTELAQWLISQGIPSKLQHKNSGQTPLHRAVVCLQKTCKHNAVAKLESLLPSLYMDLLVGDGEGNTPLHLACSMLHLERPTPAFYADCIQRFLTFASTRGEAFLKEVVNKKNRDKDTCCHILAMQDRNLSSLKVLVEFKADLSLENSEGVTALNVAQKLGQMKNSVFLQNKAEEMQEEQPEKNAAGTRQKIIKGSPVVKIDNPKVVVQNGSTEKQTAGVKRNASPSVPTRAAKVQRNSSPSTQTSSSAAQTADASTTTPPPATSTGPGTKKAAQVSKAQATKTALPPPKRTAATATVVRAVGTVTTPRNATTPVTPVVQASLAAGKAKSPAVQQALQPRVVAKPASSPAVSQQQQQQTAGHVLKTPQVRLVQSSAVGGANVRQLVLMLKSSEEGSAGAVTAEENATVQQQGSRTEDEPMPPATLTTLLLPPPPAPQTPASSTSNTSAPDSSVSQGLETPTRNSSPALSVAQSDGGLSTTGSDTPRPAALASYLKSCSPDVRRTLWENIRKDESTSKERLERLKKDLEACRQQQDEVQSRRQQKKARMQQLLDEVLEIEGEMHRLEEEHTRLAEELRQGTQRLQQEEEWVGTINLASQDLSQIFES